MEGYIGNSKWYFSHWKGREFCIGYRYRGQLEKRNIVEIYETATMENEHYMTDNYRPIPKFVYRHLVHVLTN